MAAHVLRSAERFTTARAGSLTRHCFSFGHHYDAANLSFGAVVAVNDEVLVPGAGFDLHPHAGLVIVSYVVHGTLAHDGIGSHTVRAGESAVLRCGPGVEHAERNAGDGELRFVQTWLSAPDDQRSYEVAPGPVRVGDATVRAGRLPAQVLRGHLFVATGTARVAQQLLREGDSARAEEPTTLTPEPGAELVVVTWD